jgi:opacity protein-like surface antigen
VKKIYVIAMVFLVAAVMALPGAAHSSMWVGGELGGNIIGDSSIDAKASAGNNNASATINNVKWNNPSIIGGIILGYDFVNTGFGGYNYPSWMQYFSFATDFTYNRASINSQNLHVSNVKLNGNPVNLNIVPNIAINNGSGNVGLNALVPGGRLDGYMAAWTFLFMGHYGFFPDSEVPSGRLVPYVGVGPAIVWSGFNGGDTGLGKAGATNVALVVEGGLRFMALKNVSLDAGFRYRYATPEYSFSTGNALGLGVPASATVSTTINSFSFLFRANYHF